MRFRRRVKLFPGVTLNFSRSGISTTIGVPGASVNITRQGTYLNTGVPGTGLYNRHRLDRPSRSAAGLTPARGRKPEPEITWDPAPEWAMPELQGLTTPGLEACRQALADCFVEKRVLAEEIEEARQELTRARHLWQWSRWLLIGWFIPWFRQRFAQQQEVLDAILEQDARCVINLDLHIEPEMETAFDTLRQAWLEARQSAGIWDVVSHSLIDQTTHRSSASASAVLREVSWADRHPPLLQSRFSPLHLENADGGDIYLYPAFALVFADAGNFALVDIREMSWTGGEFRSVVYGPLPADATIIEHTWDKVNKDGSPDRRFRDNPQLPVCRYSVLDLRSAAGLEETWCLSRDGQAQKLAAAFVALQQSAGSVA